MASDKDYLDAFSGFVQTYGDLLRLQTPAENDGAGYSATLRFADDTVALHVTTESLAATLYAFVDALEVLEDLGVNPDPSLAL